jgi:hypothetical protein
MMDLGYVEGYAAMRGPGVAVFRAVFDVEGGLGARLRRGQASAFTELDTHKALQL